MAGKVKSGDKAVKIDSPSARAKCAIRGTPYYVEALSGVHLGYRKGARRGVFVARRWLGNGYSVETIAVADDHEPADGERVLTFDQAKRRAIALADDVAKAAKGGHAHPRRKTSPATVREAVEAYLTSLDLDPEKKSGAKSRALANGSILPRLGDIRLRDLNRDILAGWLRDLAASARRTRSKTNQPDAPATDEERRRRRSSANRVWNVLRAALNKAHEDGLIATDEGWKNVKTFKKADAARPRFLSLAEMRALTTAAEPSFRSLIVAALHSGARYSELAKLTVGDFSARAGGLLFIADSKSGKPRRIVLTAEACAFFTAICDGRSSSEIMLRRADGSAWSVGMQDRPMRAACAKAGIERANFHALRHSYASAACDAGVPMRVVAKNLGHVNTRMLEKHYAHLEEEQMRKDIEARMPTFGLAS